MKNSYLTPFTKALLTGLFAGIIATVTCLAFNIAFREKTNYQPASLINVSSLIFVVNLIFLVIGIVYYGFIKFFKRGDIVFIIVFILLTAFLAWKADEINFSSDSSTNLEFHQLLMAMVIIMGVFAAIIIPMLYRSKKFEDHVL
ncbi:MAG: hypothetical protein ACJ75F_14205 [Flavisolibacter sp.]|jgi:hypothetical protein